MSTPERATEGLSLEAQAKKIEAYCPLKDWQLSEVLTDAGQSAKSLDRPGLQRLVEMVERGPVSAVMVWKPDRLTRSVADLDRLVKLLAQHDVALVSRQESLDATSATGQLVMNLRARVSQWGRKVIGEGTSEALQELKAWAAATMSWRQSRTPEAFRPPEVVCGLRLGKESAVEVDTKEAGEEPLLTACASEIIRAALVGLFTFHRISW